MSDISIIALSIALAAAALFVMREKLKGLKEARTVFFIVTAACVLHVSAALIYGAACAARGTPDMTGDGATSSSYGIYIAEVMTGKPISEFPAVSVLRGEFGSAIPRLGTYNSYQVSVLAYLQATVYSLLGYSVFFAKLLNSLFAVIAGFIVYYTIRRRLGHGVALLAMTLILFFPSMFIWSITALKDTFVISATTCLLLILGSLSERGFKGRRAAIGIITAIALAAAVNTTRERLIYIYAAALVLSLFILWFVKTSPFKRLLAGSALLLALIAAFNTHALDAYAEKGLSWIIVYQRGQAGEHGRTFYKIYPRRFYEATDVLVAVKTSSPSLREWAAAAVRGTAYFMFSPFCHNIGRAPMIAVVYPQSFATLLLFPFMISGMFCALRSNPKFFMPMAVFIILYWVSAGLVSGNIGTAFRHRDVMMPVYLLFSAIGIERLFRPERFHAEDDKQ